MSDKNMKPAAWWDRSVGGFYLSEDSISEAVIKRGGIVSLYTAQVPLVSEPTEEMLNAARDWSIQKYGNGVGNEAAIGCWQAMLAAHPKV